MIILFKNSKENSNKDIYLIFQRILCVILFYQVIILKLLEIFVQKKLRKKQKKFN